MLDEGGGQVFFLACIMQWMGRCNRGGDLQGAFVCVIGWEWELEWEICTLLGL